MSFDPPARRAHFGIYARLSYSVQGKRTATRLVFFSLCCLFLKNDFDFSICRFSTSYGGRDLSPQYDDCARQVDTIDIPQKIPHNSPKYAE
jgi:hypothetical protein